MSALITNGQLRKTLASVRSLGKKGVLVHVCETTQFNLSGIRCRSLLPGDILHYLANPHRFSFKPSFWLGSRNGGGSDDIISWRDPMPSIGFLLACLRYLLHPKAWKLIFNR